MIYGANEWINLNNLKLDRSAKDSSRPHQAKSKEKETIPVNGERKITVYW